MTAIADKLGVDFALIHRQRASKAADAPEKVEVLVGNVKDKVSALSSSGLCERNIGLCYGTLSHSWLPFHVAHG